MLKEFSEGNKTVEAIKNAIDNELKVEYMYCFCIIS